MPLYWLSLVLIMTKSVDVNSISVIISRVQ